MSKQAKFGTFEAHQPNYEGFKALGKLDDFGFQALAHMGNASMQMAWANTVLENEKAVPQDIKNEMKQINEKIHELQERIREVRVNRKCGVCGTTEKVNGQARIEGEMKPVCYGCLTVVAVSSESRHGHDPMTGDSW